MGELIIDLVIILAAVVVAVVGLLVVRRRVSLGRLQSHHEVAGITYAVLAGLYSVILAFVLVSSWGRFEDARHTIEVEVDALGNLWRLAGGYGEHGELTLRRSIMTYGREVLAHEWEDMNRGRVTMSGRGGFEAVWAAVLDIRPGGAREVALWQVTLEQADALTAARRERILFANNPIPAILWYFLVVFGAVTVIFTYLFGMDQVRTQAFITAALAATIGGSLVLILETQTPFQGALRMSDRPLRELVDTFSVEETGLFAAPRLSALAGSVLGAV